MPVVRVNDGTFANLSMLKTWFGTKTPAETIDRLVEEVMEQFGIERDNAIEAVSTTGAEAAMEFESAPGLSFTKPLAASINGQAVQSPRWSSILLTMIAAVKAKGLDGQRLANELAIPTRSERYEEEGFRYYPHLNLSIQGQSATDAWKEVDRLASKWGIPVKVEFWWRQNPKAQHPGRTGILRAGNA